MLCQVMPSHEPSTFKCPSNYIVEMVIGTSTAHSPSKSVRDHWQMLNVDSGIAGHGASNSQPQEIFG